MASTRPYTIQFHNDIARTYIAAHRLEGSTFAPITTRSLATIGAARARTRNLLTEQYDPRLPLEAQPVVQIYGPDFYEAWTMVPFVGAMPCDEITMWHCLHASWKQSVAA